MSLPSLTKRFGSHSSTLEDQIYEITKHALTKTKHFVGLDELLHDIRNALEKSSSLPPMNRADAEGTMRKRGVAIPFTYPAPESDANYKFAYEKPTTYNVIGSHALKTSIKTADEHVVDLAIAMPLSLFQEKDYINYRYFHKRAFYLSVVAFILASIKTLSTSLEYHYLDDDPLRPVVRVRKSSESRDSKERKNPYVIQVIPVLSDSNIFPTHKMNIHACCIRKEALLNTTTSLGQATPRYNSAILADINTFSSLKILHECMSKCDGFREACVLGALWLQKIGLGGSISRGGFGVHEWSMLMALLFSSGGSQNRPLLSANLTSLQLFKATLQFLAKRDLTKQYLVTGIENFASKKAEIPVALEAETNLNILFKMSPRSYVKLNEEAKLASNIDTLSLDNQLTLLFNKNTAEPWVGCDIWLRIPIKSLYSKKNIDQRSFTWSSEYELGKSIADLLMQGLGDRATSIQHTTADLQSWPISKRDSFFSSSKEISGRFLTFGIKLQEHNARRLVDQGPLIEGSDESKAFRAFWGDKSELRRFKDGRITETLIWDSKQPIIAQIVQYVLYRHLNIARDEDYIFVGDELDALLPFPTFSGSATVPFEEPRLLFDKLSTLLKGLEKMPLPIKDVHPVDPVLRSTSVYASIDLDSPGDLTGFLDVSVDFEASQKWPDDLALVQKGKVALLIRLAELLEQKEEIAEAKVGLEKNMDLITNLAFLDITMTERLTYRVRAYCSKERDLAEQMLLNKTVDIKTRQEYQEFSDDRTRCVDQMSRHGQVVARWCSKYAALSPVIRLFKKWIYNHLLSDHIPEELLELLVVNTFILPGRSRPASIFTGFLQTMEYLAHWEWQNHPLVVDFTGELSKGKRKELQTEFEDIRRHDPLMGHTSIVVAAAYDHHTRPIICKSPTNVVSSRLTALAKVVCQQLSNLDNIPNKIEAIFTPSLKEYDFVLVVKDTTLSKRNKLAMYKNVQYTDPSLITENSLVFNSFLSELQTIFSSSIVFFHDKLKRNIIAGLWYPQSSLRAKRYAHTYSSIPVTISDEKVDLLINKEAVLCEIRRLGDGLIKDIITNS